jgi:hypothetical protein
MIYVAASSKSLSVLQRIFEYKLKHLEKRFLIFDFGCTISPREMEIEKPDIMVYSSGTELEIDLMELWSSGDVLLNFDCFHIFSEKFLSLVGTASANFHPSLLPNYRGTNPINWGLFNGEKNWGFTWHVIEKGLDAGDIIFQKKFSLPDGASQFDIMGLCLMEGLKSIPLVLKSLDNPKEDSNSILFNPGSYFGSEDHPTIYISNIDDALRYQKILPFSPVKSWRWGATVYGLRVTALSDTTRFGSVDLRKRIEIEGQYFYYATTLA